MSLSKKKKILALSNGFLSVFGLSNADDLKILPNRISSSDAFRHDLKNIGLDIIASMNTFEKEHKNNEQKAQEKELEPAE